MDLDLDPPADLSHPSKQRAFGVVLSLVGDTIRRPRKAMARLAEQPGRLWLVPVAALALASLFATLVSSGPREEYARARALAQMRLVAERNPQAFGGQDPEAMAQMATSGAGQTVSRVTSLVGAVLAPLVAVLAISAVVHFMATLMGGQQTYHQLLTAMAWARWPLVFQAGLRAVVWGATGSFDPYPNGLEGLVAPAAVDSLAKPSVWQPLLAQVSIWNLWTLALMLVGVVVVARLSVRKAAVAVATYLAIVLILGEISVALSSFLLSMTMGAG